MGLNNFGVPIDGTTDTVAMPKLQYRFRVLFTEMGGGADVVNVSKNVISITRPGITYDETTLDVYNSRVYMIGKHTWDPITLVVRDDASSLAITALNEQVQKQIDLANQESPADTGYKFAMDIEMLDGGNTGANKLDAFHLSGCFISNLQYGDVAYASSEHVQVTATIRYDNCDHTNASGATTFSGEAGGGSSPTGPTPATQGFFPQSQAL
tara:strand:- start:112 stop:744 length:633 start_codon:yes stop_codon:yes gene_type:complete